MKKHNPTLVVNLPMINSTICQKIILQDVAPHSKKTRITKTRAKEVTLTREKDVLCPNEGKMSSIYIILMTFN
jgi:hypothetical protein